MLERLQPIGFWSYARQDETSAGANLRGLRALLMAELQQQYGRNAVQIFQDVAAIPPGADWEAEIRNALDRSTFLIPIITPAFLESEWCMREVEVFLELEIQLVAKYPALKGKPRIFPIKYIDIEGADCVRPDILDRLKRIQWTDFVDLRFEGERDKKLLIALAKLAGSIRQLLYVKVETSPLPEEVALLTPVQPPVASARPAKVERAPTPASTAGATATGDSESPSTAKPEPAVVKDPRPQRTPNPVRWWWSDRPSAPKLAAALALAVGVLAALVFGAINVKDRLTMASDQKACDAGVAVSCWAFGKALDDGKIRPSDPVRALAMYEKACDGGEQQGCTYAGISYKYGSGVPQDYARALAYYRLACTSTAGLGCYDAGELLESGKVGPKDVPGAIALYRQGAQRSYPDATEALKRLGASVDGP